MPRIAWLSDSHLDHARPDAVAALHRQLGEVAVDHCVVTGDTAVAPTLVTTLETLAAAVQCPVHFVLGNHDHYGGSVAGVRDAVIALGDRRPDVQWLPPAGVFALDEDTALIGVDGWADGGFGDPLATPLRMNDDRLIAELAAQPGRRAKLAVKQALAAADAARLTTLLERAVGTARTVVVATHVPPFVDVLPAAGHLSSADWLPMLVCRATGEVLRRAALHHPDRRFLVLAGHTHVGADVVIAPNLRCMVAPARYGAPTVQVITT